VSVFVRLQFLYITLRSSSCFQTESKVREADRRKFIVQGTELGTNLKINSESIHTNVNNSVQHNWSNRVKKDQLDEQLIHSTFRQILQVLGVSRPIIRRYNHMYITIGIYYSF